MRRKLSLTHSQNIQQNKFDKTFSWWASCLRWINGVVTTPLAVSTTLLQLDTATFGNGLLYVVTLVSSLLLELPLSGRWSKRRFWPSECCSIACTLLLLLGPCISQARSGSLQQVQLVEASLLVSCGLLKAPISQVVPLNCQAGKQRWSNGWLVWTVCIFLLASRSIEQVGLLAPSDLGHGGLVHSSSVLSGCSAVFGLDASVDLWPTLYCQPCKPLDKALAAISLWSDPVVVASCTRKSLVWILCSIHERLCQC